jgi:SAM-dependent methyltransferase
VERSDILSVEASNPKATFVGDLTQTSTLPESTFDCIVLTQTLQYIFDVRTAVATLHRALKPGGILLLTVPSVRSQVDGHAWGATWYWWFTSAAIRRLLEELFQPEAVTVDTFGNIFVATAFHFGIALEELQPGELDLSDAEFPVIVAARAIKQRDA